MGALKTGKSVPEGRTFWLRLEEPTGQELKKPLGLFSFPQLPTNTKASAFTGSSVAFRAHSTSHAAGELGDNQKARVATGRRAPAAGVRGGCKALARDAHARAAHPGPPASPGRAWQLREGRRSARRPDFSRAPAPAGPATRPDRPRLARGAHGPPPLGGSSAAPPPPRDPRALPKFGARLCERAPATHTHSHTPRAPRCPELL